MDNADVEWRRRPFSSDWIAVLVLLCCLGSGVAIASQTGKGILLVAALVIVVIPLLRVATDGAYPARFLIAVAGFSLVSVFNGSRPGSVMLVVASMLLFESLVRRFRGNEWTRMDSTVLVTAVGFLCLLALVDAFAGLGFRTWVGYPEGMARFPLLEMLPRLRLFFSEPSYLGVFAAAAMYWGRRSTATVILMGVLLLASHSLFGLAYLLFLLSRRQPRLLLLGLLFCLGAALVAFRILGTDIFFLNSGAVRLVGVSLFDVAPGWGVLGGAGIGAGDERLADVFAQYGVHEAANGFIWTFIYDAGVIGILFYFMAYCRSAVEVAHLGILLLNFGAGSFLVPVLHALLRLNDCQVGRVRQWPESPAVRV